jgi:hypothetical protein
MAHGFAPTPPPPLPGTAAKLPRRPGATLPAPAAQAQEPPPPPQGAMAPNAAPHVQNAQAVAPMHPGEAPPPQGGPYRVQQQEPNAPAAPPMRIPLRTIFVTAAGVIATVAIILFVAFRPSAPRKARSIGARLDLAAGDVTVNDANGDVKALSGTPLGAGASVTTAKGARALVRTGEGAALFLRGETSLKLLERGVDVASGEVFLEAPRVDGDALECTVGGYHVSASDAGVSIKRDGKDITVYVARGLAILTSPGGRVEITAGEQGLAKAEGKPSVTPVAFWQDWTGGMGDQRGARSTSSGTGRLYGLDPAASAGAPARKLGIAKQVVKAVLRDGIAETEVDQTFSNPGSQPIEGYYWFTVPTTAMVTGFALETNGQLVEGEVIEKTPRSSNGSTVVPIARASSPSPRAARVASSSATSRCSRWSRARRDTCILSVPTIRSASTSSRSRSTSAAANKRSTWPLRSTRGSSPAVAPSPCGAAATSRAPISSSSWRPRRSDRRSRPGASRPARIRPTTSCSATRPRRISRRSKRPRPTSCSSSTPPPAATRAPASFASRPRRALFAR